MPIFYQMNTILKGKCSMIINLKKVTELAYIRCKSYKWCKKQNCTSMRRLFQEKIYKSCVLSISIYGLEIQTLKSKTYLRVFKMRRQRKALRLQWTECVSHNEVLKRLGERRALIGATAVRRNGIGWSTATPFKLVRHPDWGNVQGAKWESKDKVGIHW